MTAKWVAADAVYGSDYHFRIVLENQGLGYVVGVRTDFAVCVGFRQVRVRELLAEVPTDAWQRLSCGSGSKGPRRYDWAFTRINCPEPKRCQRWLLIRRSVSDPTEVAYFACGGPPGTTLAELGRLAPPRHPELVRPGGGRGDPFAVVALAAEKGGDRLIRLSVPEVWKLLLSLIWNFLPSVERVLGWSVWRRRHQHRARECHYRKRGARPPD